MLEHTERGAAEKSLWVGRARWARGLAVGSRDTRSRCVGTRTPSVKWGLRMAQWASSKDAVPGHPASQGERRPRGGPVPWGSMAPWAAPHWGPLTAQAPGLHPLPHTPRLSWGLLSLPPSAPAHRQPFHRKRGVPWATSVTHPGRRACPCHPPSAAPPQPRFTDHVLGTAATGRGDVQLPASCRVPSNTHSAR